MGETINWEKLFIGLLLPGPLPNGFIKLSQELRDRIYTEVFAAGHMGKVLPFIRPTTKLLPDMLPPMQSEKLIRTLTSLNAGLQSHER